MLPRIIFTSYLYPVSPFFNNLQETGGTINNYIYFQFLPIIGQEGSSASYSSFSDTIGRSETMLMYKNSSNRSLNITTSFVADGEKDPLSGRLRDEAWVKYQIDRLMALTKPIYRRTALANDDDHKFFPPPLVLFTHGVKYVNVPVVIENVDPKDHAEAMIEGHTALSQVVDVTIQMKTNYPYGFVPGYLDIANVFADAQIGRDGSTRTYSGFRGVAGGTTGSVNMTNDGSVAVILDDAAGTA